MRSVRFSAAMSLDGYIAGPNGEYDWIVVDPDIDFDALFGRYDTLLMGRNSYEATLKEPGPVMPGVRRYVFSRTLRQAACPDVTVCSDVDATMTELRGQPGKDIWLFGGGQLFGEFLRRNLVDEVELAIVPVLLGGGIPLLPPTPSKSLQLVDRTVYEKSGTVLLTYKVSKPGDK